MIVGIDEVGRGCWAGPVVAAAVALAKPIPGLKDSKKLSKAWRERLAALVHEQALATGIGWVPATEIDKVGLTEAVRLAMQRAFDQITVGYERVIIDGNFNFLADVPKTETLVKADCLIPAVSAASIIAKVARDRYMAALTGDYLKYQFDKHVGYGTVLHKQLLEQYGVSDLHRMSYNPIKLIANRTT